MMTRMKRTITFLLILITIEAAAQKSEKAFIRLVAPTREINATSSSKQFVSGATCRGCKLTINKKAVKVYPTGGFAYELDLIPGPNHFNIEAEAANNSTAVKKISYNFSLPVRDTVKELDIASIKTFPEGDLVLSPGDIIKFRVKALPSCVVMVDNTIPLFELPTSSANPVPGIYQGEYSIKDTDIYSLTRLPVTITDSEGRTVTKRTDNTISVLNPISPAIMITKGRLAHLLFGLGDDRLGGAKIGYIDSLIPLHITGKVGSLYKVQLTRYRTAYIPDDVVDPLPKGTFAPQSLTGDWRIYGDSAFDYVQVGLFSRLPYQSFQLIDPAKIVVDIFGATNNTNWITQMENTREIKNVYYEQIEDEVLRVTIELKHRQHWGYQLYYSGNNLVVKVKRQPADLSLRNLRIAIDAGHGGGNTGTYGPTGSSEKELALAVSLKLRQALQMQGAKVLMTRITERFVDNKDRILMYRDSLPDLLVSIHFNSSADPIYTGGTSTYYRHIGFRNLSRDIYKRMLELGLKEYGNTGSFNFMLNSPIEYPNALVEILFLSNPEEEMLILEDDFQQKVVEKIVLGIKDFLAGCKEEN
jgi:N-acetylmuramoyl-L-alanine amidase